MSEWGRSEENKERKGERVGRGRCAQRIEVRTAAPQASPGLRSETPLLNDYRKPVIFLTHTHQASVSDHFPGGRQGRVGVAWAQITERRRRSAPGLVYCLLPFGSKQPGALTFMAFRSLLDTV